MKFTKLALIVLIVVCFASCEDAQEPETHGYVVALGIDLPDTGEEGYNITIQFANPDKISGGSKEEGGKGGKDSIENITVLAPGIYPAINIANHIISKQFVLSHTKLIVFSDEVARSGVKEILETIARNGDIRPNIYFAVSKGSASEFLNAVNPKTEVNPVRYYTMIFENDYSGFIPQNMGRDFYIFYGSEEKSTVIPLCSVSKNRHKEEYAEFGYQYEVEDYIAGEIPAEGGGIQIAGMAVFSGDRKVEEYGDIETEIFNILTGEYQSSYVSYYFDDKEPITVMQQQKSKPKISVEAKTDTPKIKITVYLEAQLSSGTDNGKIEKELEAFSDRAAEEIKSQAESFLNETSARGTDVVGFGSYAKRNFKTIQEFQDYDWSERYKNAEFEVKVQFSVLGTGLVVRSEG